MKDIININMTEKEKIEWGYILLIEAMIKERKNSAEELSAMACAMGDAYRIGDEAYRNDRVAKKEIEGINRKIYKI
jgi:hypothetical protein